MSTNLDVYKADLDRLIADGALLELAMNAVCSPREWKEAADKDPETAKLMKKLPSFHEGYQTWYSEAVALLRQLLPDRLADFVRHYQKPKPRKDITFENYRIEDYLQGLTITRSRGVLEPEKVIAGPSAAIPHFQQQLAIVRAVSKRFDSTLFDIRQLVQADLFDSEIEAARELQKSGFMRASGAVAGVVLEKHLKQVCQNHKITFRKKHVTISDCNEALKKDNVIDVPQWRHVQLLGDIRNLCDHSKGVDPTKDQITDLLSGVAKIIKTIF